jgi:hypothetical protein
MNKCSPTVRLTILTENHGWTPPYGDRLTGATSGRVRRLSALPLLPFVPSEFVLMYSEELYMN